MPGHRVLVVVAAAVFACVGSLAAPHRLDAEPSLAERAGAAFVAQNWSETAALYAELARGQPTDAQAQLRLGIARLHLGDGQAGLAAIEKARELGAPPNQVSFRLACAHAVLGDAKAALAALDTALAGGFSNLNLLRSEPLLAALRSSPETASELARRETAIDRGLRPCKYDPKYREFDYWLGIWDVVPNGAPPGTPVSENVVTLEYDDCIVHEHWKGSSGVSGESFNLYDASRGAWFQTWVDSTGGMHEYRGNLDEKGNMAYTAELAPAPGQPANERGRVPTRLTFFKLETGQVRQLSEQSSDGGKSWTVAYDLIYTRRKR